MPEDDLNFADWITFTDQNVPPEAKRLITVEGLWRDWLREKYATLDAVNTAHGASWDNWSAITTPRAETDLVTFWKNKSAIRKEFLSRNYRLVLTYMVFHGRAALNTLILVIMTMLGQLTVQPLAAYGLSRFRLRYSHKVLLFLLATMAFPAEVAMIPNFLMIKELGLLNTYWALVLPGLASGMGIFLLKGYFDSLPKELYEAAMIDGAGEFRMFFQITVPLSMPILAVIALGSFAGAYGGFMWAFLICQKPQMWTLMVFLWQLGSESYPSIWMASLVIAAIPTLLVFVFCQRIILRGIIVPTMK
jgi:multiple sugar transport system permease protein